jgi:hypothetical protein
LHEEKFTKVEEEGPDEMEVAEKKDEKRAEEAVHVRYEKA